MAADREIAVRLGISSLFAENLPLFDYFPYLQTAGISLLEVYCYGYPSSLDEEYWKTFARKLNENNLQVYSFHTPFVKDVSSVVASSREEAVRDIQKSLVAAKFLGAQFVIVHPGVSCDQDERKAKEQASLKSLKQIYFDCREKGLKMAVENMPLGYVGGGLEGLALIMEGLPTPVGVCLDAGHAFLANTPPEKFVQYFGPRLYTLHLHDNNGMEDQHFLPGEGKIRWPEFIEELKRNGFKGVLMMEVGNYKDPKEIIRRVKSIEDDFLTGQREVRL